MAKSQKSNLEVKGLITNVGDLMKPPGATDIVDNFDLPAVGFLPQRRGINRDNPAGGLLQSYNNGGGDATNPFKVYTTPFWGNYSSPNTVGSWMLLHTGLNEPTVIRSIKTGASGDAIGNISTPDGTPPEYPRYNATLSTPRIQSRLFTNNKNSFITAKPCPVRIECTDDPLSAQQGPEQDGNTTWAGMPRPGGIDWNQQLDANEELEADNVDPINWLKPNYAVGYRVTFLVKDRQGVLRESAPSAKYIIANSNDYRGFDTGKTASPITRWQIPTVTNTHNIGFNATIGSTPGAFLPLKIRLYRTISVDLTASGFPNDEYYLAFEGDVTPDDFTAGFVTITDYTPEFGLSNTSYFNSIEGGDVNSGLVAPTQGAIGLAAENDRPPFSMDGAMFQNCVFYGNIKPLRSLTISILATGSTSGVMQAGDTVAVSTTLMAPGPITAVSASPASPAEFRIHTSLAPSAAWSLRRTCENMCAAFNKLNTDVCATYIGDLSNPDNAGKIYFECKRMQEDFLMFETGASTSVPWISPAATVTPTQAYWLGEQITNANGLAISKPNIPDAVPPANYTLIGGNQTEILRLLPTSDGLFIFLTQGVWICRGTGPNNFVFTEFDPSFKLWAPELACVMNDQVYAWGQQGIYRISAGSGMEKIDVGIANYVNSIQQYNRPSGGYPNNGWAVAQPNWNRVMFWFPDGVDEPPASIPVPGCITRALVFHADTQAWTTYSAHVYSVTTVSGDQRGRAQFLGATYRQWDQSTFFTQYKSLIEATAPFQERYLLCMNPTAVTGPVSQYDQNPYKNDTTLVNSTVQWQATIPNPGGLAHWSDFEYFTQPYLYGVDGPLATNTLSPIGVSITSDLGKTTSASVTQYTTDKGRIILGTESGYATRQTVKLSVTGPFFAFNGFSFLIRKLGGLNTR